MNEQIKKLAELASDKWVGGEFFDREKFAKLIVEECIQCGDKLAKCYIDNHPEQEQAWLLASIADYSSEIKRHFGVEE